MKSSKNKQSVSNVSTLTATPVRSTPATLPFSSSLRNHNSTSASSPGITLRTVRPTNQAVIVPGRKSPLKNDSRSRRQVITIASSPVKIDGSKSMRKHYLSKSNDSLSGANGVVNKKSKSQPVTATASRGIRHPVVEATHNKVKDKEPAHCQLPVVEAAQSGISADGEPSQEMRRSVSSNSIDLKRMTRDEQRRLSIPQVNMPPTVSLLSSNFGPSQPGIALISCSTQTDTDDDMHRRQRSSTNYSVSQTDSEFETLLHQHSEMSRQLSDLCKMEPASSMEFDTVGESVKLVEWDSQSNTSMCSEPSMACLQDRIQQMEETHHSTHEELQATLQELAEMGDLVTVYKRENEELAQEKSMLQEALCSVTEKVHVYQTQAESLKKMLYRQAGNDENSSPDNATVINEKEKTLLDLMKTLQEERDELHHQLESALEQNGKYARNLEDAQTKLQNLDHWCDQVELQKNELERQLNFSRESIKRGELETARLAALLDIEKTKVVELQTVAKVTENVGVEDLASRLRMEKERIEGQLITANDRVRLLESDNQKLMESMRIVDENRSAAEKKLLNINQEFNQRLELKDSECKARLLELGQLRKDHEVMEQQLEVQEKRRLEVEESLQILQNKYTKEQKDWEFFQEDLLTAVRVANDFRTECELTAKNVLDENLTLKRKTEDLINELDRMKTKRSLPTMPTSPKTVTPEARSRVEPLVLVRSPTERENSAPRTPRTPSHPVCVRSLVQNMESNIRQGVGRPPSFISKPGIRRRDDNFARSESNSSLESNEKQSDSSYIDDEPSMPGDGLKPILSNRGRNSVSSDGKVDKKDVLNDPLENLVKGKGSKRNGLLKWCQEKTARYPGIDITNFSSSWNDGLAFCSLIHSYLPDRIPFDDLDSKDKRRNFTLAFEAAKLVGITPTLDINDLLSDDRPDWRAVMDYVISIYKHFEM